MEPLISVIICTHNPRPQYLSRVFAALRGQTLNAEQWELLVIDNLCDRPLSAELDLSWHPQAFCLRENRLGLTPARVRGIREAGGDLLIFVDDDNVLDPDYLEVALSIGQEWPKLGAWGGQIRPEFEQPPPDWTKPYWGMLCIRELQQDRWSNFFHQYESTPVGAGLCIRRWIAQKYTQRVQEQSQHELLDRKGQQLSSAGDTDLTYTVYDLGLGTGAFASLKMTHLIPSQRLEESYLLKLREGLAYSVILLDYLRGQLATGQPSPWQQLKKLYRRLHMTERERRFDDAVQRGEKKAFQLIKEISSRPYNKQVQITN
uniref:Glycosyl transferase family 2 n=1 Tax=Cyanothece sp. (strain PCC 7425 / ATCC 29141) TaxID=395961 RepID=B8HLJ7_CYAP4